MKTFRTDADVTAADVTAADVIDGDVADHDFDRAMRDRYRQAIVHVSPPTRAQLRANRHAATRGPSKTMHGWPLGAAFGGFAAVVFAITLGLNFNSGMHVDGEAPPVSTAASDMFATASGDMSLVTALDQDPDFYAWLASSDAQLMAME
ncbi:MAG: hypothetical protein WKF61_08060 [Luteimonas sp.]